ncbi:MAG TPA: hypothetical protein VJB82_01540 [Candidatus Peribacterales bacterium]|nr:hypothetical protein [Candidatus Peribacterales bacterium]
MQRSRKFSEQSPLRKELFAVTEVLTLDEHVAVSDLVVVRTLRASACDTENILGVANAVSFCTALPFL